MKIPQPTTHAKNIFTTPPIKVVTKNWGWEEWLANSQLYCAKKLYINEGFGTSIHHHKHKTETLHVVNGEFRIMIEGLIFEVRPGDTFNIYPYQVHKMDSVYCASGTGILFEVSTQHFDDDSIRHGYDLGKYFGEFGSDDS